MNSRIESNSLAWRKLNPCSSMTQSIKAPTATTAPIKATPSRLLTRTELPAFLAVGELELPPPVWLGVEALKVGNPLPEGAAEGPPADGEAEGMPAEAEPEGDPTKHNTQISQLFQHRNVVES